MKRLSKEERIGAIVLAIVALIVIGGGAWWRFGASRPQTPLPSVTVVYADTTADSAKDDGEKVKRSKANKSKGDRKGKGSKKKGKSSSSYDKSSGDQDGKSTVRSNRTSGTRNRGAASGTTQPAQWRDPLADTIPTKKRR